MLIPFQFTMPKFEVDEGENPFAQPPWYQDPTTILLGVLVVAVIVGVLLYYKNNAKD